MKFLNIKNLICILSVLSVFSSASIAETQAEMEQRLLEEKIRQCRQLIEDENPAADEFCASIKIRLPTIRPGSNNL